MSVDKFMTHWPAACVAHHIYDDMTAVNITILGRDTRLESEDPHLTRLHSVQWQYRHLDIRPLVTTVTNVSVTSGTIRPFCFVTF